MTLQELKSLKVGQIVKYTNDVDPLNIGYWRVESISGMYIRLNSLNSIGHHTMNFDEEDIDHIASMLTVDEPLRNKVLKPERELRLIEAKIRDAEWAMEMNFATQNAILMSPRMTPKEEIEALQNKLAEQQAELQQIRNQRNALICPNSDHTN